MIPAVHRRMAEHIAARLQDDDRILGVAVGGSWIDNDMDEFSDIDLVVVSTEEKFGEVLEQRRRSQPGWETLLAAFTGEHVGEPRLLICLFADPLMHVDLKFISLAQLASRVEDPVILWQRGDALSKVMQGSRAHFPLPDLQWIEDRFWIWVHYAATKLGRRELVEVIDFISYLRSQVLGPLLLMQKGHQPRGVRRIESAAPEELPLLLKTVAKHDVRSCADALYATVELYRRLRDHHGTPALQRGTLAEQAATAYLAEIAS